MSEQTLRLGMFRNMGEPIRITEFNFAGVNAKACRGGESASVWTQLALTSDEALFHQIVPNLAAAIELAVSRSGGSVSLARADTVLLVLRPDDSGEVWADTAAVTMQTALKRPGPIPAGSVLFEHDVADITGMWFPLVEVGPNDRILCLFREGWRFALFFDVDRHRGGELSIEAAQKTLGSLYRRMKYADLYAALADQPTFEGLVSKGWFPFLELMSGEFKTLLLAQQAGWDLADTEAALIAKFDDARLERLFARWMERAVLEAKAAILRSAIDAFKRQDPVAVIKILLSEIEGVMAAGYHTAKGERTHRIEKLLAFVLETAEQHAGGKDTLFFPVEFGRYLKDYTYVGFAPGDRRAAGSRHAVGHGAVEAEDYTMTRALQVILTLDQIAFHG
ncbi:hypothetical protein [Caulobacter segnis]|uniref:hypothetical protein n=1 Tax=Caulobacter segnis TaxID=88688 RepID=UPI00285BFEC9|nr:hypothetical protein [Caulobacter segnis]MDR6624472.1 hypothetical protein [Caulobacter segnis]